MSLTDLTTHEAYTLVGIVKDFHQTSVKYKVQPMAFKYNILIGHCSLKISTSGLGTTEFSKGIETIKQIWQETYPTVPLNYFFLEDKFAIQEQGDRNFENVFKYFTILSILLSSLGLFTLSILLSVKRQREIGVRKVFGASSLSILKLFLKEYIPSLTIAFFIGAPIAYYLMNQWLTAYAYKIEIGAGIIIISAFILVVIFLGTVAYHTIKSSLTNPSRILKE